MTAACGLMLAAPATPFPQPAAQVPSRGPDVAYASAPPAIVDAMLELGASKPWPDALEAFTGERQMSGKAMVEYFAPLKKWLDQQNKGQPQGW